MIENNECLYNFIKISKIIKLPEIEENLGLCDIHNNGQWLTWEGNLANGYLYLRISLFGFIERELDHNYNYYAVDKCYTKYKMS